LEPTLSLVSRCLLLGSSAYELRISFEFSQQLFGRYWSASPVGHLRMMNGRSEPPGDQLGRHSGTPAQAVLPTLD